VLVSIIEGIVQGRRWAGKMKSAWNKTRNGPYQGSIYDSSLTFESYGVAHGDRAGVSLFLPTELELQPICTPFVPVMN
jgi:hypothetical protein